MPRRRQRLRLRQMLRKLLLRRQRLRLKQMLRRPLRI